MIGGPAIGDASAIEVLTGSPFGAQLAGDLPFFDPHGWDPRLGIDTAVDRLGWTCHRAAGGSEEEAVARLRAECAAGPVLVGPVELGLLRYWPDAGGAIGADHYLVVLGMDDDIVRVHDPHGFPFGTLPVAEFVAAWRAESIAYAPEPFELRSRFRRVREVDVRAAVRAALPAAARWLDGAGEGARPEPGSVGGPAALALLADRVAAGPPADVHAHLVRFAVPLAARRLADAAWWLAEVDRPAAAAVAERQARSFGGLQYHLVTGDTAAAVEILRRLGPGYADLRAALG
ncbi:hypothetical protein SAMN05421810_11492 [Amycolatopsis arida]|uniref:Butirosin biosynthesis protein H, N-terminal n=1 Tax=Amycolatopsis arida TaxID=587909 RepID=A0A1I6ATJ8_9PSEU|nr:hypothetical protein [Amycolatopsis arida]TDX97531.1 hypothetical protein CLV69_102635 [Amycolatopsis arida]SFQ71986.1 hypothetical protein SAMN05421810_11492 [Amycolatopsis arida]